MALNVLDHPVAHHYLAELRDRDTEPQRFRELANQVTTFLTIEATRDLPLRDTQIQTPLEMTSDKLLAKGVTVVAILRAGMAMLDRVVQLLPDVSVGYVGMERDELTAEARTYYCKLPDLTHRRVIVVDPMLATGGSAEQTLDLVRAHGAEDLIFVCIVAAPEGIARLERRFPGMDIFAGVVDRELNAQKYILPGLGDFGDRLYGT